MIKAIRVVALCTLVYSLAGCAGSADSKPQWVEAEDANLPALATFGWADRSGEPPVTILDNQIRDAIRAELVAKGYAESSETPDFRVSHETLEQDAIQQGNPVRIGIGVGSWGGNVGGSVGTSVDVGDKEQVVQQLRVNIHALEGTDDRELWFGTTAPIKAQPAAADVNRAIGTLMKAFPGKGS